MCAEKTQDLHETMRPKDQLQGQMKKSINIIEVICSKKYFKILFFYIITAINMHETMQLNLIELENDRITQSV